MSERDGAQHAEDESRDRARRRARLAAVFGEVLPETTADERDDDVRRPAADPDGWLRDQVPPHHG